ncbi:MAG: hypothetical protein KJ747_11540 [Actinobacteria bacterium]|nr:hypothetical protein [Actinomycetota bacterium]
MDQEALRVTLDALRKEAESAEVRVHELEAALADSQQRLQHLRGAVQNIQFIVGDDPSDPFREEPSSDASLTDRSLRDIHGRDGGADQSIDSTPPTSSGIKRTPSTDWMVEIVNASGRALTREEAFAAYEQEKGIPESWTNPRTAMANALGRAVKRELIKQLPGDRYAPLDFDPYMEPARARLAGQVSTDGTEEL